MSKGYRKQDVSTESLACQFRPILVQTALTHTQRLVLEGNDAMFLCCFSWTDSFCYPKEHKSDTLSSTCHAWTNIKPIKSSHLNKRSIPICSFP